MPACTGGRIRLSSDTHAYCGSTHAWAAPEGRTGPGRLYKMQQRRDPRPTAARTARWSLDCRDIYMAWRHSLYALLVVVGGGAAAFSCRRLAPPPSAEELVLQREVQKLRAQVEAAESGTLLDFDQMLVVVDQELVQRLLASATPLEGDVEGFHVRIDTARAEFTNGVALVHLDGAASVVGRAVSADMSVYGGLDVVELDPASGVLRARLGVYAVEIPKADLLGIDQPARRLTKALAEGGLEALLGPIEVPVRIEDRLRLPALRTRRVRIPALDVPVAATVSSVRVFAGRLWVGVKAKVAVEAGKDCADGAKG